MTRKELAAVIDTLTDMVNSWNDAAYDGDRGRANDAISLTVFDDGSGFIGRYPGGGRLERVFDFDNTDGLVAALKDEGWAVDAEPNPEAAK